MAQNSPTQGRRGGAPRPTAELLQEGLALHKAGRGAEAAAYYEEALRRDPQLPAANHLLGLVRLQAGRPDEAAVLIERAVRRHGSDPQYWGNYGVALNGAGKPREALAAFDKAIALKPDFAEAWSNRGMALRTLGRHGEAADSYRRALKLRPGEAGFNYNLGNVLADEGDWLGAEAAYRAAIAARPAYSQAIFALALTLGYLNRLDEAEALVRAGLARMPADPELHYRLGRTVYAQRRVSEAVESYRKAISLRPSYAEAHQQLAVSVRRRVRDAEVGALERLFGDTTLPADDRIFLGFGLAKALADVGEHDRSVEIYDAANAIKRAQLSYSVVEAVADLAASSKPFEAWPTLPDGDLGANIVFVIGLPRSGKTTIEGMLARHPSVHPAGELKALERFIWRHLPGGPRSLDLAKTSQASLQAIGRDYLDFVSSIAPAGKIVVDTMPGNFRQIGMIRTVLPGARVIHAVREPVGHRIALYEKLFAGTTFEYTYEIGELATYYGAYLRLMDDWRRLFPGFVLDIDVATFSEAQDQAARRILAFAGLDFDPAVLEPVESEPQLGEAEPDWLRANRAAHREAWQRRHPAIFPTGV